MLGHRPISSAPISGQWSDFLPADENAGELLYDRIRVVQLTFSVASHGEPLTLDRVKTQR